MPRILSCKVKSSLKLNVPILSFANRYYKQCFTPIFLSSPSDLNVNGNTQSLHPPPSCTCECVRDRGTEGREEDANKASISRVGRPQGDSQLHPSSYCTRGNQGTSAHTHITLAGISHNSSNCHKEFCQFLTDWKESPMTKTCLWDTDCGLQDWCLHTL